MDCRGQTYRMSDDKIVSIRRKVPIVVRPRPLSDEEKMHLRRKVESSPDKYYTVGGVVLISLLDEIRELRSRMN